MIVNKKYGLALTVIAFNMLLPVSVFATDPTEPPQQPETWRLTLGRWGSNAWKTSYPVAAQLGALAGLVTLASLHSNKPGKSIISESAIPISTILSHILRENQSEGEHKHSLFWGVTDPAIIHTLIAATVYLAFRENDRCPARAIPAGLLALIYSNMAKTLYNNIWKPTQANQ